MELDTAAADATGYNDTTVSASTTYGYSIRAFNGVGESASSNVVDETTPAEGPPAPLSCRDFNEGSGTSVDDACSENNDGTAAGGMAWADGGGSFDGADDVVNAGTGLAGGGNMLQDFTISLWLKPDSSVEAGYGRAFRRGANSADTGDFDWSIDTRNGSNKRLSFEIRYGNLSNDRFTVDNTFTYPDSAFSHWVIVCDCDDGKDITSSHITIYKNGVSQSITRDGTSTRTDRNGEAAHVLFIGAEADAAARACDGGIDDIRVWDTLFTSGQVTTLYNAGRQ